MRHELLGVNIDDIDTGRIETTISAWLRSDRSHMIVTPNPEFLLRAQVSESFKELINRADLSVADGVGLRFAISALTDGFLRNRHAGVDLVETLVRLAHRDHKRVLFVGGEQGTAEQSAKTLKAQYHDLDIHAIDPGKIDGDASGVSIPQPIIEQIGELAPAVLVVGLGAGKQERCIQEITRRIPGIRIGIGVGGSFESIAGTKPRAPKWMRGKGLEWIWRLTIEPSRANRIAAASIIFPITVVWATLRQRIFLRALRRTVPEIIAQLRGL